MKLPGEKQGAARFEVRNLVKYYTKSHGRGAQDAVKVLNGVNMNIQDGMVTALVGESGSGKSTLARLIMGIEDYDEGEILYKNQKITPSPGKEFRRKNQMMFQNPLLSVNPYFKVKKIISEPLAIEKIGKGKTRERLGILLDILELSPSLLERYPGELSGGQLQRVVLARALALEPEFIVLDEPFSSLDEITAGRLMIHFKKIFKRLRLGVLLISHHPGRVRFLAGRIYRVDRGKVFPLDQGM